MHKTKKSWNSEVHRKVIINEIIIGKYSKRMGSDDTKALIIKFDTAYCRAKNKSPFSFFPEIIELKEKNCSGGHLEGLSY